VLLDVNNVFVTATNTGETPLRALEAFAAAPVKEIHLAGHETTVDGDQTLRIDTHDRAVCDDVWRLFEAALSLVGGKPTLIEWDDELPSLNTLLDEARKSARLTTRAPVTAHAVAC